MPSDEVREGWKGIESVAAQVRALGRRALVAYADIRFADQVDCMVAETLRELGGIDLLVNNARAIIGGGTMWSISRRASGTGLSLSI